MFFWTILSKQHRNSPLSFIFLGVHNQRKNKLPYSRSKLVFTAENKKYYSTRLAYKMSKIIYMAHCHEEETGGKCTY
jgi:hypothetical protein